MLCTREALLAYAENRRTISVMNCLVCWKVVVITLLTRIYVRLEA